MKKIKDLKIKIFADGAKKDDILKLYNDGNIKGFTTNPSLMKQAGITDYTAFAKDILSVINDLPFSFEVFSDNFSEMEREARIIAGWGKNVYIKIPITNSKGESSIPLIKKLSDDGLSLNITAVMPLSQVEELSKTLNPESKSIVSVFAGRIADTGVDPIPHMENAVKIMKKNKNAEVLWASPRELLNIFHAESAGCHIITVLPEILKKLALIGKNISEYSLETVQMFYNDAQSVGYRI